MLSQDEKRILLAKHFGWTDIHGGPPEGGMFWRGTNPRRPLSLKEEIPDYFNDLNAVRTCMFELHQALRSIANHKLAESLRTEEPWFLDRLINASAEQRAEALGQILNLW